MESAKTVWVRRRPVERFLPDPKAKLRDQVHEVCRFKRFSTRTEKLIGGGFIVSCDSIAPQVYGVIPTNSIPLMFGNICPMKESPIFSRTELLQMARVEFEHQDPDAEQLTFF